MIKTYKNKTQHLYPIQLAAGRNTLISSLTVTLLRQVGHLAWAAMAVLMHALQNMCPHFVEVGSTSGPIHIGQLKVGSFGGGVGDFGATCELSLCPSAVCNKYKHSVFTNKTLGLLWSTAT